MNLSVRLPKERKKLFHSLLSHVTPFCDTKVSHEVLKLIELDLSVLIEIK
jgi:hypothetical protein